jgi:hypothetical protein
METGPIASEIKTGALATGDSTYLPLGSPVANFRFHYEGIDFLPLRIGIAPIHRKILLVFMLVSAALFVSKCVETAT